MIGYLVGMLQHRRSMALKCFESVYCGFRGKIYLFYFTMPFHFILSSFLYSFIIFFLPDSKEKCRPLNFQVKLEKTFQLNRVLFKSSQSINPVTHYVSPCWYTVSLLFEEVHALQSIYSSTYCIREIECVPSSGMNEVTFYHGNFDQF